MQDKQQGTVSAYVETKGFGYITQGTTPKDIKRWWFHISSYCGEPVIGARVLFHVKPVMEGPNPTAIDVEPVNA